MKSEMKDLQSKKKIEWIVFAIATAIFIILFLLSSGTTLIIACQVWIAITCLSVVRVYLFDLLLWGLNNIFAINPTFKKGFLYKIWFNTFGSEKKSMNPFTRIRFHLTAAGIALLLASVFLASQKMTENLLLLVYQHLSTFTHKAFMGATFWWLLFFLGISFAEVPIFKSWFSSKMPMPWSDEPTDDDEPDRRFFIVILFSMVILKWIINILYFEYNARLVGVTALLKIPHIFIILFAILYNILEATTKSRLRR